MLAFIFFATNGTYNFLKESGIESTLVKKLQEGSPNCVEMLQDRKFVLVINTTSDEKAVADSYMIRRSSLETHTPCLITISAAYAFLKALDAQRKPMDVLPL